LRNSFDLLCDGHRDQRQGNRASSPITYAKKKGGEPVSDIEQERPSAEEAEAGTGEPEVPTPEAAEPETATEEATTEEAEAVTGEPEVPTPEAAEPETATEEAESGGEE
jgi:hypothetical protein